MVKRKKCKPRIIPPQNTQICGCICFCQLIIVLSSVSIIYLTVAIYIPAYRAFESGFEEKPVMCQTTNISMINNCNWASCGEWCLTRTSGFCPQIFATVRQNGTTVKLKNCKTFDTSVCPPIDFATLKKYNCNNGSECATLHGVFNCSLGHCLNLSQVYDFEGCHYKADGFVVDSDKDNAKLNGYFECKGSKCTKIKKPFSCNRICKENITSSLKNVFITMDDGVHQASCEAAYATTKANGNEEGEPIEPTKFWEGQQNEVLMMSCHRVWYNEGNNTIWATDCINGTVLPSNVIPQPYATFKQFWNLPGGLGRPVDTSNRFVPSQRSLTIYNASRLYINLDGCVNTLKGECQSFLSTHGRDGKNHTAPSRYVCYYNKNSSYMTLARHDLNTTWNQLVVAVAIPSFLFVTSAVTLCIITHAVRVDDDTRMRCKYFCHSPSMENGTDLTEMMSRYEVSSPESDRGIGNRRRGEDNT